MEQSIVHSLSLVGKCILYKKSALRNQPRRTYREITLFILLSGIVLDSKTHQELPQHCCKWVASQATHISKRGPPQQQRSYRGEMLSFVGAYPPVQVRV